MPSVHVLYENADWLPPLREALDRAGLPVVEHFVAGGTLDLAELPEDIKYDFDIIVSKSQDPRRRGIYTFGGDRETFEPPQDGPPGPPFEFAEEVPDLRVDNDVWRFAPSRFGQHEKD